MASWDGAELIGQHHSITMPSYQRDRLSRYLAWFNKYLRPEAAGRPTTQR
jgi:hypothetical protein